MPVFAIFFPLDVAVATTAIVHFLNNLFKLYLLGRLADRPVVIRFGLPAIISALLGAWLLLRLSALDPLASYYISGHEFQVMPVKVVIAAVMVFFAVLRSGAEVRKCILR